MICFGVIAAAVAHGWNMWRVFRREYNFSAVWKLAEKYSLVGMNSLGVLNKVFRSGFMLIRPLGALFWR